MEGLPIVDLANLGVSGLSFFFIYILWQMQINQTNLIKYLIEELREGNNQHISVIDRLLRERENR